MKAHTSARFTYPEVGLTRSLDGVVLPDGYRVIDQTWVVGSGRTQYDAATECLLTLGMQRRAGLSVRSGPTRVAPDSEFTLGIGIGPFRLAAPCRVVYTIEEADRTGFAYGTVEGHPESGEVRFELSLDGDDAVRLRIASFSRPATWLARLSGPIGRRLQDLTNRRYLAAIEAACAPDEAAELDRHFAVRRVVAGLVFAVTSFSVLVWVFSQLEDHPVALGIAIALSLVVFPVALWARIAPASGAELARSRIGPKPTLTVWLLAAAWVGAFLLLVYNSRIALQVMAAPAALAVLVIGVRFVWRGTSALFGGAGRV